VIAETRYALALVGSGNRATNSSSAAPHSNKVFAHCNEFRSMIHEQNPALGRNDLVTLEWYPAPQHNEDNLYQWLELHLFDPELPTARVIESK